MTDVCAAAPAGGGSDEGGAGDEASAGRAVGRSSELMILTRARCGVVLRAPVEPPLGWKTATNKAVPNNSAAPAGASALDQRPERRPGAGPALRELCERGMRSPEVSSASRSRWDGAPGLPGTKAIARSGGARGSIWSPPHRPNCETAWVGGEQRSGASFRGKSTSRTSVGLPDRMPPAGNRRSDSSGWSAGFVGILETLIRTVHRNAPLTPAVPNDTATTQRSKPSKLSAWRPNQGGRLHVPPPKARP